MNCESYLIAHVLFSLLCLCTGLSFGQCPSELLSVDPICQGKGEDGAGLLGLCSKLPPAARNILNICVFFEFHKFAFYSEIFSFKNIYLFKFTYKLSYFIFWSSNFDEKRTLEKMDPIYFGILWLSLGQGEHNCNQHNYKVLC